MISLGTDFVAGRKRVPNPATGNMALVTLFRIYPFLTSSEHVPVFFNSYSMKEKGEEFWSKLVLFFLILANAPRHNGARFELSPENLPWLRRLQFDRG
jgi:hypothetical protein